MGTFLDCGCGCDGVRQEKKFILALMYTIVFFIFASPMAYKATYSLFGVTGMAQFVLHGIFFLFVIWTSLNIKNELMVGALSPLPPKKSGGTSVENTMELPDPIDLGQPWVEADGQKKRIQASENSMLQPWAEVYTLGDGPAPPLPPPTQNLLPSPIIPALFSTSSKNTVGFEDVDQPGGIIYTVI